MCRLKWKVWASLLWWLSAMMCMPVCPSWYCSQTSSFLARLTTLNPKVMERCMCCVKWKSWALLLGLLPRSWPRSVRTYVPTRNGTDRGIKRWVLAHCLSSWSPTVMERCICRLKLRLLEQDKPSDIEQQPPYRNCK